MKKIAILLLFTACSKTEKPVHVDKLDSGYIVSSDTIVLYSDVAKDTVDMKKVIKKGE
jgi:hypothetical protein